MRGRRRRGLEAVGADAGAVRACPFGSCDGSGWILGPENVARPCECRERRIARARSRGVSSVVPKRFRDVSFELVQNDGIDATVLSEVRAFADDIEQRLDEGRGLWLRGEVGTGKTALAMLVSKAALEAGRTVAIYSLPKLLARIRRTYEAEVADESYVAFFNRLTSVDLLHLDDLGVEKRSDWVLEQLYAIINERYETKRSILVTTNLGDEELEAQVGKRTVSRIVEMCGDPLLLYGQDLRYLREPGSG